MQVYWLEIYRIAYLDLGRPEFQVAVEYDGQQYHTSSADLLHDERRRAELRSLGWRIIIVRRDVFPGQIADLLHQVADTLIQQGWQPGARQTTRILARISAARRRRRLPAAGEGADTPHRSPDPRASRSAQRSCSAVAHRVRAVVA